MLKTYQSNPVTSRNRIAGFYFAYTLTLEEGKVQSNKIQNYTE
jgi:hypothetical protein